MDDTKIPDSNDSDEPDFDETSVPESDSSSQSQSQDDLSDADERKMLEDLLRAYVGDVPGEDKEQGKT